MNQASLSIGRHELNPASLVVLIGALPLSVLFPPSRVSLKKTTQILSDFKGVPLRYSCRLLVGCRKCLQNQVPPAPGYGFKSVGPSSCFAISQNLSLYKSSSDSPQVVLRRNLAFFVTSLPIHYLLADNLYGSCCRS